MPKTLTESGAAGAAAATLEIKDTRKDAAGAAAAALEIKDTRTGAGYSVPILTEGVEGDTTIRAMDLRKIKTKPEEFGLMTYDPAFMNTASCKSAITFIDGDKGILRYRGYPDRAAGRERDVPRGGVAAAAWGAAEQGRVQAVGARHHVPHLCAREHQRVPAGVPVRRAPDVDALQHGGGAVVVLSRRQEYRRPRAAKHLDHPAAGQGADAGGVCVPAREGAAVHLSRQRSQLRRELPLDGGADVGVEIRRRIRCS